MTIKKKISRVFAVALAIVLMMALAVPSFAEWTIVPDGWTQSTNYLNLYGSGAVFNGRRLSLWSTNTPGNDQKFQLKRVSVGGAVGYVLTANGAQDYAINRSTASGSPAIMWKINTGFDDSRLSKPMPDPSNCIVLMSGTNKYLTANDQNGAYAYFGTGQQWSLSGTPNLPISGDLPISAYY